MANIVMGLIYLKKRQWEKAIAMGERALALDPNGAEIHNHYANFLNAHIEIIVFLKDWFQGINVNLSKSMRNLVQIV